MSIFEVALESFIDMNHALVLLSRQIDWESVEPEFAEYYCVDNGVDDAPEDIYLRDEGVTAQ